MKLSLFADTDNGASKDDFVGCDTLLKAAIGFNGQVPDGGSGGGGYGDHPPAQTIMLLNRDMNSFIVTGNTFTDYHWLSRPFIAEELINNMNAIWNDGSPIIGSGCGHNSCATGSIVKYAFPGDPNDLDSWSMLQSPVGMSDYSYFINMAPVVDFQPGETVCIDVALTSAIDENGDHLDSYTLVKQYAETVKAFYDANFPASCFDVAPGLEETRTPAASLKIYPVPANDYLMAELPAGTHTKAGEYHILDLTGRIVKSAKFSNTAVSIDVSQLQPGMYIISVQTGNQRLSAKFIKQ